MYMICTSSAPLAHKQILAVIKRFSKDYLSSVLNSCVFFSILINETHLNYCNISFFTLIYAHVEIFGLVKGDFASKQRGNIVHNIFKKYHHVKILV